MNRSIYIKIISTAHPGCEVNLGIEGDCSKEHRDEALKFVEAICSILDWKMEDVEHSSDYSESTIVEDPKNEA